MSVFDQFILLPFLQLFGPALPVQLSDLRAVLPPIAPPDPPPCGISPLPPLDDEEALSFEAAAGTSDVVDRSGLTPATAIALSRFERRVENLGGTLAVTSAYRPPAYQAHLQLVWDKWQQLQYSPEAGCAVLRAQVEDEFQRHSLLPRQRPVDFSDHTRGVGFDASVLLPPRRGRLSIDRLAIASGVRRPDVAHDPVHFRLIASPIVPRT